MTILKERYEQATNFENLYEGLLGHISHTMTSLEASEQEDTVTYDQSSKLFAHLSTEEGKAEYSQMRWDAISGRCTEEDLEKVILVEQTISDNLELLEKTQLSSEGNTSIIRALAEKIGMEVGVAGDKEP